MDINTALAVFGAITAMTSAIVGVIVYFHSNALVLIKDLDEKFTTKLEELQKSMVVVEKDMLRNTDRQPVSDHGRGLKMVDINSLQPSIEGQISDLQERDLANKRSIEAIKSVVKTHQSWIKQLMRKD